MKLKLLRHNHRYETEKIIQLFMPFEKAVLFDETSSFDETGSFDKAEFYVISALSIDKKIASAEIIYGEKKLVRQQNVENALFRDEKEQPLALATVLYSALSDFFGVCFPWGALTGVRPVKLLRKQCEALGEENALKWFKEKLFVSAGKTELCVETLGHENEILALSTGKSFSLYIAIPFCPTRCSYCSFVSHDIAKAGHLVSDYVDFLCREIEITLSIAKKLELKLETIYIGGGTPTSLNVDELKKVTDTVSQNTNVSLVREYTVEAGRPDTIDREKLAMLKKAGVTRISINPQTLHDNILENIGRKHTVKQFFDSFKLARDVGFSTINVDLIAALPGDTFDGFCKTLDQIIALAPENITVHTLAHKRSSELNKDKTLASAQHKTAKTVKISDIVTGELAAKMVGITKEYLAYNHYVPYYLYKQSKSAGNMENVGWAKKGHEGLYNVYIMDETHSIFGCGAGAVTKLVSDSQEKHDQKIERVFNYKFPYEYISGFDEIIKRKKRVINYYD